MRGARSSNLRRPRTTHRATTAARGADTVTRQSLYPFRRIVVILGACLIAAAALIARPARAETVTATLTYQDGDGKAEPITNATVEIWRHRQRVGLLWGWGTGPDMTAF